MPKKKAYSTLSDLAARIAKDTLELELGKMAPDKMHKLVARIRELEERILIIRYQTLMQMEESAAPKPEPKVETAPELPLEAPAEPELQEEIKEPEEKPQEESQEEVTDEALLEDPDPNQISLIDSIEEIKKEESVNDKLSGNGEKSLAQSLEAKPIDSVMTAFNLNLKLGLINELFAGDESLFEATMGQIDSAQDADQAQDILKGAIDEEATEGLPIKRKLNKIIQRRFS